MAKNLTLKLFSGTSHPELAKKIAENLGIPLSKALTKRYVNTETLIEIDECIRGEEIYIIQSGCEDVNYHLIELLIMVHACKINSARSVYAVLAFYPYSRQAKRDHRAPITAKLVANMLKTAGADHVITMDLHASQIQGFFDIPVDNLWSEGALIQWIKGHVPEWDKCVLISPDNGGLPTITDMPKSSTSWLIKSTLLMNFPNAEIIILGDFNIHNSSWLHHYGNTDEAGRCAEAFAISRDLTQLVNQPTRMPDVTSRSANILHLFLRTDPEYLYMLLLENLIIHSSQRFFRYPKTLTYIRFDAQGGITPEQTGVVCVISSQTDRGPIHAYNHLIQTSMPNSFTVSILTLWNSILYCK